MRLQQWSRSDQVLTEGALWALPVVGLVAGAGKVVHGLRADTVSVTGPLPAALARPGEGVQGPLTGTVSIPDPSLGERVLVLLPLLLGLVLAVVAARLLLGLVRALRTGDPFTAVNARRLAWLGLLIATGGFGVQVVDTITQDLLLRAALPVGQDRPSSYDLSYWPVPVSLFAFCLAEVVARGARMREDVEGLV